jgi:hypothetical protein
VVPGAARPGRAPRVEGAVHGDERRLRGSDRGGRNHGARPSRPVPGGGA